MVLGLKQTICNTGSGSNTPALSCNSEQVSSCLGKLSEQSTGLFLSNPGFYFVFFRNCFLEQESKLSQMVMPAKALY